MKKIGIESIKRLNEKTPEAQIMNYLRKEYKFSPAMSQVLMRDSRTFGSIMNKDQREEMQITYQAVSFEEPAGKPLKECEMMPVVLTVYDKQGLEIKEKYGLSKYRRFMIEKLTSEAEAQGATLTHEDLSVLLHIERKAVAGHIKKLRAEGKIINTRASYTDSGRGVSHKTMIVKMYLYGYAETVIAARSKHNLKNVESYIKDFLRVSLLHIDNHNAEAIVRLTGMTIKLVKEYLGLYEMFSKIDGLRDNLKNKIRFYQTELLPVKKKKWTSIL